MKRAESAAQGLAGGLSRRQFFAIVCSFWTYVALSNVLYAYSMRTGIAESPSMPRFAPWDARVLQHVMLLPFLLISFWASLRIQWRPLLVAVPLQLILGGLFAAIAYPAMILANLAISGMQWHDQAMMHHAGEPLLNAMFVSLWLASFVTFLPSYGFGLALVTGLALYIRFRNAQLRVADLEREWSSARLTALRMQLSPHTLFNLLHTIRGNIDWDPKGAQSMVVQLADLLRRLLNAGEREFTRLADEIQFVRLYLELQQRRFADRLTIELPESRDLPAVWVPSLILQPLVENAVVHGLAGHQGPVVIRVAVHGGPRVLTLRVSNTVGKAGTAGHPGIGLKNVRERLAVQFDGRASLSAGIDGSQWVSEIHMPEVHVSPDRSGVRTEAPLVGA